MLSGYIRKCPIARSLQRLKKRIIIKHVFHVLYLIEHIQVSNNSFVF